MISSRTGAVVADDLLLEPIIEVDERSSIRLGLDLVIGVGLLRLDAKVCVQELRKVISRAGCQTLNGNFMIYINTRP
jgi:hypothetical protein